MIYFDAAFVARRFEPNDPLFLAGDFFLAAILRDFGFFEADLENLPAAFRLVDFFFVFRL